MRHERDELGAPIVLLHGVGLDSGMWAPCTTRLSRHAHTLTPDLLGHGRGGTPPPPLSLAAFARDVADGLAGPAHLVGFSLGALVAQRLALDHPLLVRSLVLVSSVADRTSEERAAVLRRLDAARRDPEGNLEASIARWTGGDRDRLRPEHVDYARRALAEIDREAFVAAYEVFAHGDRELWPLLGGIRAPTLAVTGGDDPGSTPRMTAALAAAMPDARAHVVEGARHLLPLERPDLVAELILDHARRHDDHRERAEDLRAVHRG
jgi:(E)-2-((N-methylformamido)methylene)succinate hydrolase